MHELPIIEGITICPDNCSRILVSACKLCRYHEGIVVGLFKTEFVRCSLDKKQED